jgi:hypothetical protein
MNRPFLDFLTELESKRISIFYEAGIVVNSKVMQIKSGGIDFEVAFNSLCDNLNQFMYPKFTCYDIIERDFYRQYLIESGWNKEYFRELLKSRLGYDD